MAAIQAGVDVIAHTTPQSGPWGEALTREIQGRRVALTPTLSLWKSSLRHDQISTQETLTATAIGQLQSWVASGGTVLFGTDIGAIDYDPSEEYVLMARAGLNFRQILATLTTAPAAQFGDSERLGRIAVGFEADLVVLSGHPSRGRERICGCRIHRRRREHRLSIPDISIDRRKHRPLGVK